MNSKIVDIGINLLENPNKKKKEIAFFNLNDQSNETEKIIPEEFICPLSKKIMKEPVNIFDGSVFEKENIIEWFEKNKIHPITKKTINSSDIKIIIPNINLKNLIKKNYLCYEYNSENEKIISLIKNKLYKKKIIFSDEKDEIIDSLLESLIKLLKSNLNEYNKENEKDS